MKLKELKTLPKIELGNKLAELRKELMKSNAQIALGAVPSNPGKVKAIKKTIARINTFLHEKPKQESKAKLKQEQKEVK